MRLSVYEWQAIITSSTRFVRNYLTGIFLVFCLIVLSIFWSFSNKSDALIREQLRRQGQAFFQEVVITRQWITVHKGVYVKFTPGMQANPYLLKIPGLKVVIRDSDGDLYILKNPALVTREISELANVKGLFTFKITSLNPLNPSNAPDSFEQKALQSFTTGNKEYFSYIEQGNEVLFRYMAPLMTEKNCLRCHGQQGYREGDIRGGISVTITATDMMRRMKENRIYLVVSALLIVALFFAIIYFVASAFIRDLKKSETRLLEMATKDFLTGLLNRAEAYSRLQEERSRSLRFGKPLSIIMIDIDHFKQINDTHGHSAGDEVLKAFSAMMQMKQRSYDVICRYGGEEFLIITPATNSEKALEVAERLRCETEELMIPLAQGGSIRMTISAGVAQLEDQESIDRLIIRADSALYAAKADGRNRVQLA